MQKLVNGEILDLTPDEEIEIKKLHFGTTELLKSEDIQHSYREARAKDYVKALGHFRSSTDFTDARLIVIGDILDAIIKYITGEDLTELEALIIKIKAVKTDNPKPTGV